MLAQLQALREVAAWRVRRWTSDESRRIRCRPRAARRARPAAARYDRPSILHLGAGLGWRRGV